MRKDSFFYREYAEYNIIRERGLKMQATDTERMLIIEQKRRSCYEKI
jgi:hypothetical protein